MPQGENSYRGLISAAIFILLEVAALTMLSRSNSLQNIWSKRFSHRVMESAWRGGENLKGYFSLKEINERLSQENFALSEELRRYKAEETRLACERESSLRHDGYEYIPATILKMSRNSQHNYIIIDKGSEDGVTPLSGIITDTGVVGIIDAVDRHFSYGMTMMNTNVTISARLGKRGVVAPLSWDGIHSDRALMKELPLHYPVAPGDTVWTSGFSSIFPPDVPVGIAVKTRMVNGSTNQASVKLFQDFSTLRFVTVVKNPEKDNIEQLINGQEK